MQKTREDQFERGDVGLEGVRVFGHAEKRAAHLAVRRGHTRPAAVLELFAGFEQRLLADHRQPAHVLALAMGIGDDPVPRRPAAR